MQVQTYWISRSSNSNGGLACNVDVWYRKPVRCKLRFPTGHAWMPSHCDDTSDLGLYGSYTLDDAIRMFKTIPDTDIGAHQVRTKFDRFTLMLEHWLSGVELRSYYGY